MNRGYIIYWTPHSPRLTDKDITVLSEYANGR